VVCLISKQGLKNKEKENKMPSDDGLTPEERRKVREERETQMANEIAEMEPGYIAEEVEAPVVEEEPVVVEEPVVEEPVVEEPVVEGSEEAPVVEGAAEEDDYDFSFINEMARNAILKMESASTPTSAPTAAPQAIAPASPVPISSPPAPIGLTELITITEMEEAFTSPEKFLDVLNKVASGVYQRATADAEERALVRLPQVARQVSMQVADQAEIVREFYKTNKELVPYKDFVRYCAMQVEAKHPDWTYDKVSEETAKVAKSRLPSLRRAQRDAAGRPALPGAGRNAPRKDRALNQSLSAMERDIASMPDKF
jgi:hypothetical protein